LKSRIRGLVFDLDDTLIDTSGQLIGPAHDEAAQAMIAAGLPGTLEEVATLRRNLARAHPGESVDLMVARSLGCEDLAIVEAGHRAFYQRRVSTLDPLPGVPELLAELRTSYRLFLVTVGHPPTQQRKVDLAGLVDSFDGVRYVDILEPDKLPAIAGLLSEDSLRPEEVVVVGDRVDGEIRAARELGCWAVRVARGEGQWAQSPSPIHQPHYTVPDVTALPAVLEDIQLGDESP